MLSEQRKFRKRSQKERSVRKGPNNRDELTSGPAGAGPRELTRSVVGAQRLPGATEEDGTVDDPKGLRTECRGWRR